MTARILSSFVEQEAGNTSVLFGPDGQERRIRKVKRGNNTGFNLPESVFNPADKILSVRAVNFRPTHSYTKYATGQVCGQV
jgi:hypothetical protein